MDAQTQAWDEKLTRDFSKLVEEIMAYLNSKVTRDMEFYSPMAYTFNKWVIQTRKKSIASVSFQLHIQEERSTIITCRVKSNIDNPKKISDEMLFRLNLKLDGTYTRSDLKQVQELLIDYLNKRFYL